MYTTSNVQSSVKINRKYYLNLYLVLKYKEWQTWKKTQIQTWNIAITYIGTYDLSIIFSLYKTLY